MQQKIENFAYKYKGTKLAGFFKSWENYQLFLEFVKNNFIWVSKIYRSIKNLSSPR